MTYGAKKPKNVFLGWGWGCQVHINKEKQYKGDMCTCASRGGARWGSWVQTNPIAFP